MRRREHEPPDALWLVEEQPSVLEPRPHQRAELRLVQELHIGMRIRPRHSGQVLLERGPDPGAVDVQVQVDALQRIAAQLHRRSGRVLRATARAQLLGYWLPARDRITRAIRFRLEPRVRHQPIVLTLRPIHAPLALLHHVRELVPEQPLVLGIAMRRDVNVVALRRRLGAHRLGDAIAVVDPHVREVRPERLAHLREQRRAVAADGSTSGGFDALREVPATGLGQRRNALAQLLGEGALPRRARRSAGLAVLDEASSAWFPLEPAAHVIALPLLCRSYTASPPSSTPAIRRQ
ncbi:MAG TPA: hypothetical protein VNO30_18570 [Kofleriaceae bacterium]|nr:hypothetical protein [Kofleriaceae bacterium]